MATTVGTLVMLRLEARQRKIVTLSGTGGSGTIAVVGGLSKTVTFATDLATTTKNFVTANKAAYLAAGVIVTSSGAKLAFTPKLLDQADIGTPTFTNVAPDLAGAISGFDQSTINLIGETATSLKSAQTMIETSSKLSGNNSTFKAGRIVRTISVSSIASTDTATTEYGHYDALQMQDQELPIDFVLTEYDDAGDVVPGALNIAGSTLMSNVTEDTPDNDKLTFALDLQINDDIDITVNA